MSADLVQEVERAISDGDADRVYELVLPLKEKERRAVAKPVRAAFESFWNWQNRDEAQQRAGALAWAGTATARQLASTSWVLQSGIYGEAGEREYQLVAARGSRFVTDFVRMNLRSEGPGLWPLVRRAVREGVIERPDGDEYVRAMVFGIGLSPQAHENVNSVYEALREDPDLIEEIWLVFEHEVGGDLAHQNAWRALGPGQYENGENRWIHALRRLAVEGDLDRQRLLDASLDALMRDFRPSTLTWYVQLHEALEPTLEERQDRLDRYLALITSPAAPALKAGLGGLKELGDAVPSEDLARAATPALVQPQKTHAIAMLRQLESAAKRDEESRPVLLGAAAQALSHEKQDVQERALKLLERYEEDAPRAELLSYLDAVAPTLRPRVDALTGLETKHEIAAPPMEELTGPAALAVQNGRWPDPRLPDFLPPGEALTPVESVDELIELASALLEDQGTGDEAERFLEGVSRLCGERPQGFERRTEGLVKRAHAPWVAFPDAVSGHHLVSLVVLAWARGTKRVTVARPSIGGFLVGRAIEIADRARKRQVRPVLSFPTHAGGWLDPSELERRPRPKGLRRADRYDATVAHLRTLAGPGIGLMPELTVGRSAWGGEPPSRVGVQILEMSAELQKVPAVVDSLRWLGRDTVEWYFEDAMWPVADTLGARWLMTLMPAFPEIQFARALTAIVDFVDGSPYRHPEVVLEWMLDPAVPLRDPAWTAVAAALVAKSPDLQRAAADVVVATVSDGRFDPERLGSGIAWLLAGGFGTLTRIEAPLRDAGRVSPLHAAQIVRALEALLAAASADQRHLHVPLGLALDLAASAGTAIESEPARMTAERIAGSASKSSKVGKAAGGLLALEREAAAQDAILRLAASAAAP